MSGHVFKLRMGTKPQKKATVLIPLISGHVFKLYAYSKGSARMLS